MAFKALEDAIQSILKRLGAVEGRTGSVETDLGELESRVADLEAREQWRSANAPAFLARGTGNTSKSGTASTTVFPFSNEVFDNLGDYNNASYRFTAPVAGIYSFSATLTPTNATGGPEFSFYKNGSVVHQNAAIGYNIAYHSFTNSILLLLDEGDYVDVRWQNNNNVSTTIDGNRSTFSGFLIS